MDLRNGALANYNCHFVIQTRQAGAESRDMLSVSVLWQTMLQATLQATLQPMHINRSHASPYMQVLICKLVYASPSICS